MTPAMPTDPPAAADATYARRLGLFSATMLVVGGIIVLKKIDKF